jgi:hypothetical protein
MRVVVKVYDFCISSPNGCELMLRPAERYSDNHGTEGSTMSSTAVLRHMENE